MDTQPIHVLLVEDNPGDARFVREMVREVPDLSIHHVDRLATAIEHLAVQKVDVVLLDLGLPDSQGLETLRTIVKTGCGVPVVVLTGHDDEAVGQAAVREGAQDYLVKGRVADQALTRAVRYAIERKRAQAHILEQHATLSAILEGVDFPIFSLDREYRYTSFNRAHAAVMKALYGTDIQLGGRLTEYQTVPEDWQAARKNIDRTLQGEAVLESASSGDEGLSRRYFEVAHHPVRTDAGEIIGVSVFAREVTSQKRAEAELRFSNLILSTQQEASIDGILVVDENAQILSFNQRFVDLWGVPPELVEMKADAPVLRFVAEQVADPAPFLQRVQYLYDHAKETSRDEIGLKDGRTFDRYSAPMVGSADRNYGRVWYFRDITERTRADRELQESKQLVDSVVENVPLMIFLKEAQDLRFVVFNKAGEELLGHDRKDLLGKNNLDLFPPEQAAFFMAKDREVLAGGTLVDISEEPILTAKKGTRTLHTRKLCIKGADGVTKYLLGISEDITERKQAETRMAEQLDELRRWHQATLGREGRVLALKKEVNELLVKDGQPPRYASALEKE